MSCVQCCPKRLSSLLVSAQIYKLDAECDWANWYGKSNLFCQGGVCKYLNGAMFDHTKPKCFHDAGNPKDNCSGL